MRADQPFSLHAGRGRAVAVAAVQPAADVAHWSPAQRLVFICGASGAMWAAIILAVKAAI